MWPKLLRLRCSSSFAKLFAIAKNYPGWVSTRSGMPPAAVAGPEFPRRCIWASRPGPRWATGTWWCGAPREWEWEPVDMGIWWDLYGFICIYIYTHVYMNYESTHKYIYMGVDGSWWDLMRYHGIWRDFMFLFKPRTISLLVYKPIWV